MLTIIGGELKGCKLSIPKGKDFRPTLGKTREALFSVISSRFQLANYLCYDVFAGSGALGIEALSRGAIGAVFVENNKHNYLLLKKNIKLLPLESRCKIYHTDAIQWISQNKWDQQLNLFFVDPPYQTPLAQILLNELDKKSADLQNSLVIVESHKKTVLTFPPSMVPFQQKKYGSTKLDFLEITNRS